MIALNDRTRLTVLPISFKLSAERKEEQIFSVLLFYVFSSPLGVSIYTFGEIKHILHLNLIASHIFLDAFVHQIFVL